MDGHQDMYRAGDILCGPMVHQAHSEYDRRDHDPPQDGAVAAYFPFDACADDRLHNSGGGCRVGSRNQPHHLRRRVGLGGSGHRYGLEQHVTEFRGRRDDTRVAPLHHRRLHFGAGRGGNGDSHTSVHHHGADHRRRSHVVAAGKCRSLTATITMPYGQLCRP